MVEWENEDKDAHPASPAEKEILIFNTLEYNCLEDKEPSLVPSQAMKKFKDCGLLLAGLIIGLTILLLVSPQVWSQPMPLFLEEDQEYLSAHEMSLYMKGYLDECKQHIKALDRAYIHTAVGGDFIDLNRVDGFYPYHRSVLNSSYAWVNSQSGWEGQKFFLVSDIEYIYKGLELFYQKSQEIETIFKRLLVAYEADADDDIIRAQLTPYYELKLFSELGTEVRIPLSHDITGWWRIAQGPLEGWLIRGNSYGRRASLHTAPGVAIFGEWEGEEGQEFINFKASGGSTMPGELAPRVRTPGVINYLNNTTFEICGTSPCLSGEGATGGINLKKENWRVFIEKDKSTSSFNPNAIDSDQDQDGNLAIVKFDRSPRDIIGAREKYMAARARLIGPDGEVLEEALTTLMTQEAGPKGSLDIDIFNRQVDGQVSWTGMKDQETPYPPGTYTIEIVIRDGMAEKELEHKVNLGSGFRITNWTKQFAPGHEPVVLEYEWFPREASPREFTLEVWGKSSAEGDEPMVRYKVYPRANGTKVHWEKDGILGNGSIDWTDFPFKIRIQGEGTDGVRQVSEKVETTVKVGDIELVVDDPPPPQGQAARWYDQQKNELSADIEFLEARAKLKVIDSQGKEKYVRSGIDVHWECQLNTFDESVMPRAPGFYSPQERGRHEHYGREADVAIEYEHSNDAFGQSAVSFKIPARSLRQDRANRRIKHADRFKIKASVPKFNVQAESKEYRIGPGMPANIRQLTLDEIRLWFHSADDAGKEISDRFYFEYFEDVTQYIDNMSTYLMQIFMDAGPVRNALREALSDQQYHPVRYIGTVRNVPYRGVFRTSSVNMPIFLGGYAGAPMKQLGGGQALIVLFDVTDAHGNPIPVSGPQARKILCTVSDDQSGTVPPFVMTTNSRDADFVYRGRMSFSPFGPYTYSDNLENLDIAPLGIHGIYYVAGMQPIGKKLKGSAAELGMKLQEYGEEILQPPDIPEIDDYLTIQVVVDDQVKVELTDIQLVKPGTYVPRESASTTMLKWLIAGEVDSIDMFKAEVALGVIPVLGDGRDIVIHNIKHVLFGKEPETFDNIVYSFAVIGLISDLFDWNPAGIVINGFIAAGKGTAKWARATARAGRKAGKAIVEFLGPFAVAARKALDSPNSTNLDKFAEEIYEIKPMIGMVEDSLSNGGISAVNRRLDKLADCLDYCNPLTCMKLINDISDPVKIGKLLDTIAPSTFDELRKLAFDMERRGVLTPQNWQRIVDSVIDLSDKKKVAEPALEQIIKITAKQKNPAVELSRLADLSEDVLRHADPIFRSEQFARAAEHNREVLIVLRQALETQGRVAAMIYRNLVHSARGFEHLTTLIKHADEVPGLDLFARMRRICDHDMHALNQLGGIEQFEGILGTMASLATKTRHAAEAKKAAEGTLKITEDILHLPPPGTDRTRLTLEHVNKVRRQLTGDHFQIYINAVNFFRRSDGTLIDGILTQANRRASPNFLNVASQGENFAVEVVGTASIMQEGKILVSLQSQLDVPIPSNVKIDSVECFGFKGTVDGGPVRTLEGDVVVRINGERYFIDWKNYRSGGEVRWQDVRKAREALKNRTGAPVENVLFLSPRFWGERTRDIIEGADLPLGRRLLGGSASTPRNSLLNRFLGAS